MNLKELYDRVHKEYLSESGLTEVLIEYKEEWFHEIETIHMDQDRLHIIIKEKAIHWRDL